MSGGINRFEQEASDTQCVDALDVIYKDGDLSRRPAYKTVQIAAPFVLPAGAVTMATRLGGAGAYTTQADRVFTTSSFNEFFIGCDVPFTGIDWRYVTRAGFTVATSCRLEVSYSRAADSWQPINRRLVFDTTRYREGKTAYAQPLSRDGRIAWHYDYLTDSTLAPNGVWGSYAFTGIAGGVAKYWIRLRIVDRAGALTTLGTTVNIVAPGVRVFTLSPVSMMDYRRYRGGRESLIIGADRNTRQSVELGAMLGTPPWDGQATEEFILTEDEGPGVFGQTTWPQWQQYVAGVWTDQGAPGTPTYGTSGILTKNKTVGFYYDGNIGRKAPYEWFSDLTSNPIVTQWRGAVVRTALTPSAATASTITVPTLSVPDNYYAHCRLYVTAKGGGGTPVGEWREIVKHSESGGNTVITFYDAFSINPDTNNRFAIILPNAVIRTRTSVRQYEASTNAAHTVTPLTGRPFSATTIEAAIADLPCNFEIGWPTRWSVRAGERWSSVYSPDTNELFLTNGESGLLSYDGKRLRRVVADTKSPLALQLSGAFVDKAKDDKDPDPLAKGLLSTKILNGRFLADWNGHIAIAGLDGRPQGFAYSAPGGANRIWPYIYNSQVRDGQNHPISGIGSLDGRPVIWTPSAIHFGDFQDNGTIIFRPLSAQLGFVSHHGVCRIPYNGSNVLVGPNSDGVYVTNGSNPVPILDRWDRLVKGGANTKRLHLSVAAAMISEGYYFIAFAGQGSNKNNYLGVFDYNRSAWWLWSCSFGVSSLSTIFDAKGYERLLIGGDDGHVMTLVDSLWDDYNQGGFEGYAVTKPFSVSGDLSASMTALMVTARNDYLTTDEDHRLNVKVYLQRRDVAWQSASVLFDRGAATFATIGDTSPVFGTGTFYGKELTTKRIGVKLGADAHLFQVRVGGKGRWALRELSAEYRPKGRR